MITVSLCMIVKNEEETLPRCLTSAADLVDELIIVLEYRPNDPLTLGNREYVRKERERRDA